MAGKASSSCVQLTEVATVSAIVESNSVPDGDTWETKNTAILEQQINRPSKTTDVASATTAGASLYSLYRFLQ